MDGWMDGNRNGDTLKETLTGADTRSIKASQPSFRKHPRRAPITGAILTFSQATAWTWNPAQRLDTSIKLKE